VGAGGEEAEAGGGGLILAGAVFGTVGASGVLFDSGLGTVGVSRVLTGV
jgi:hypothetical protein